MNGCAVESSLMDDAKKEYLDFFTFNGVEDVDDDTELMCPNCQRWSGIMRWRETEVGCEDCGSHDALECPECYSPFDHVFCPPFGARQKPKGNNQ